jgi:6-pyruvoyl-tetrahydropterin synthase related domain
MFHLSSSHSLVLYSLIYSLILFTCLFVYRIIYPKKRISLFILLLLVSLLPLMSVLRQGSYQSGDLSFHVMEAEEFYKSLQQGNIFPIWAGDMNATYGYPAFLFFYILPFYITSLFHFLGFSFINSVKLLLVCSFLLSGVFMYLWLRRIVNELSAFTGAILYLFAPYHLIDLHFRVDVGEVLSFVFIPLILYAATSFIQTKKHIWIVIEMIAIAFLILSHPAIALAGFVIASLYILILISTQKRKRTLIIFQIIAFINGILLTSFYVIPVLYELKYTYHGLNPTISFSSFPSLFYSPWLYGLLFQGNEGQLAIFIGYIQLLLFAVSLVILLKRKVQSKDKRIIFLSLSIIIGSIFMMTEPSQPFWRIIPFINSFQFSYRFMGITMFALSVLGAIVAGYIKNRRIIFAICFIAIFSTLLNWGNRKNIPAITDAVLQKEIPYTATNGDSLGQAITKWSDPQHPFATKIPKQHIQILKGNGKITQISRTLTDHMYLANMKNASIVQDNTLYFPGWIVYVDKKKEPLNIQTKSVPRGLISFPVVKGKHLVNIKFEDTAVVTVGKIISSLAVFMSFIYLLWIIVRK